MEVTPGALLGTEEEYVAGEGTYVSESAIYSALTGEVKIEQGRRISVIGKTPKNPTRGELVYGRIEEIFEPVALVRVMPSGENAELPNYASLHASRVKQGYVKSIRDEVRIGDVIRAKIVEMGKDNVVLTTTFPELGVIKAFCCACRHSLALDGESLKCENCGNSERRKLSKDYGHSKMAIDNTL